MVGVMVELTRTTQITATVVQTDQTGGYRFDSLLPGKYTVTFSLPGFRSERRTVTLGKDEQVTISIEMMLAALTERLDVVGVSPLIGAPVDRQIVPASVATIGSDELSSRGATSLSGDLNERLGSISLENTTTNVFQPTLRFRGFTASPLLGLPQGIAVFQNGVRVNEPFGDTVQFDLIPMFALSRIQLSAGVEPIFGLNALGGALALQLKNGFENNGFRGELSSGSFGRVTGTAELGANRGRWAVYMGATRFDETGWRVSSNSGITQVVGDLSYRSNVIEAGMSVTYADTVLNGNGPAPVELLAVDRASVFTYPDTTQNRLLLTQGRFNVFASPMWSLQATVYRRALERQTLNGDEAEFSICNDVPGEAPTNTLCADRVGEDEDEESAGGDPLVDTVTNRFITAEDVTGDAAFNRTDTRTVGHGASIQAATTKQIGDRDNVLTFGTSIDFSSVGFSSTSEVGTLTGDRSVVGSGLFAGIFPHAPDDRFNTGLDTNNRTLGFYVSNTLSLSNRTHLTISSRYNRTDLAILDRLGTSLNGTHAFQRLNSSIGLSKRLGSDLWTFVRYSESSRMPTAAELTCSDPEEPCRVPNAFISDPPLEQAVARSAEGGVRGQIGDGTQHPLNWSATVYKTLIKSDIIFVASPLLRGTGFFKNAGSTSRLGMEAELHGTVNRVTWFANYGLVQATFGSSLSLPSNQEINSAATAEGAIAVRPGDLLPGIPRHSFKTGSEIALSRAWNVAIDTMLSSNRVFLGDEGNDQDKLAGYGLINMRASYLFSEQIGLFFRVNNLLDAKYATSGVLAEIEIELAEIPGASDPRFISPGPPRSAFTGVRFKF